MIGMQNYVVGLRLEVRDKRTTIKKTGKVTNIKTIVGYKLIDSRPQRRRKVTQVTISYDQGGILDVNSDNYYNYSFRELK